MIYERDTSYDGSINEKFEGRVEDIIKLVEELDGVIVLDYGEDLEEFNRRYLK